MRDSFDHYFTGWSPNPDEPAAVQAEFAALVTAVGAHIANDPAAAREWHAFQLDGKKECFFHFVRLARDAGTLPPATAPLLGRLKAAYPKSLG